MTGSADRAKALEATSAEVMASGTRVEAGKAIGVYHAQLLRVDEEYQAEAEELTAKLQEAEKANAKTEVAKLIERLHALPRHEEWAEVFPNVVTDVGARDILDKYLAGSTYTAAIVMGLKGTGTAVVGDTMASHASWSEVGGTNAPAYSGNRPTPAFSAASSRSKQTSSAVSFTFTSGGTVAGCFINQGGSATKDNTTGILVSAGDFTGGSKTVANTDVLNVTYTLTLS